MLLLTLYHLLARLVFLFHRSTVRPLLPIRNGFVLSNHSDCLHYLELPFQQFVQGLIRDKLIIGPIDILQKNICRAKVVFKASDPSGSPLVVKWINQSALFTYYCPGFPETDISIHGSFANLTNGFIPSLRFRTSNSIAIEFISVVPLDKYLFQHSDASLLSSVMQSVFKGLSLIYSSTISSDAVNISLFNSFLIRDYNYMRQVSEPVKVTDILVSFCLPPSLEELYVQQLRSASLVFEQRSTPWLKCLCLRDLGLHNFIYQADFNNVVLVDVEDAYQGSFLFDLAWLSASLCLTLDPLDSFRACDSLFRDLIFSLDTEEPYSSLSLYYRLLASYLIFSLLNPSLLPSGFSSRPRLLRLIYSLVEL